MKLTDAQIEELAEEVINDACLKIQNKLGATDGGLAGQFFGVQFTKEGKEFDVATQLIINYIRMQDSDL